MTMILRRQKLCLVAREMGLERFWYGVYMKICIFMSGVDYHSTRALAF
jgi:hypothetical protein